MLDQKQGGRKLSAETRPHQELEHKAAERPESRWARSGGELCVWVLSGACLWAWLSCGVRGGGEKLPTSVCPTLALNSPSPARPPFSPTDR